MGACTITKLCQRKDPWIDYKQMPGLNEINYVDKFNDKEVWPNPRKTEATVQMKKLQDKKALERFIGHINIAKQINL